MRTEDGVEEMVRLLGLIPHPEGGFYKETYRAKGKVGGVGSSAPRHFSTAIYFLLPAGQVSRLHRIKADEVWHHYAGGPLVVVELEGPAKAKETMLGVDLKRGERPQHVVPAGTWFGAYPAEGTSWALVGCTVSPAFDFADLELGERKRLLAEFPGVKGLVTKLT